MSLKLAAMTATLSLMSCGVMQESQEKETRTTNKAEANVKDPYADLTEDETTELALWQLGVLAPGQLVEADKDKDGKLSETEREEAKKEIFEKCDDDENGKLSLNEMIACIRNQFDANKDGKLDETEMEEFKKARKLKQEKRKEMMKKKFEEYKAEQIKKYDKDGDGEISVEENEVRKKDRKDKWDAHKKKKCDALKEKIDKGEELNLFERIGARWCKLEVSKKDKEEEKEDEKSD